MSPDMTTISPKGLLLPGFGLFSCYFGGVGLPVVTATLADSYLGYIYIQVHCSQMWT